ncbi:MAG: TonB-dependent receptor, partial [Cyclobacteriaceae bacterium]
VVQNGILDNNNSALRALGIPKLIPETSFNLGSGITYRLSSHIGVALDLYQITIKDRIVLSGQVTGTGDAQSPIDQVLNSVNTSSAGFFLNAVDSNTKGIDIVINLDDISWGKGLLSGNIAGNFNHTAVKSINLPEFIENNNLSSNIFSREDVSRMETWRPRQKLLASLNYKIDKFSSRISTMYFGEVTYRHSLNPEDDRTYSGKTLTDISLSYQALKSLHITLGANNIFNVYPDELSVTSDRNVDFVGRFKYPWKTTQFGIDGTRLFTQVKFTF